jgi:hypothetical protein
MNRYTGSDNTRAILADLAARGIRFDLIDGVFRYCNEKALLNPEEEAGIDICRPSLTEALRRQRGLCVHCGRSAATRPDYRGTWRNVSNEGQERFVDLHVAAVIDWQDPPNWQPMEQILPPLWCGACWQAGIWKP